jgi:4,5-DOPA dioxygenase extradiol
MAGLPSLFVSHGAPTLAIEPGPAHEFLKGLGAKWPKPAAIVVASAHWLTAAPTVDGAARPETIHDFGGFPQEMYEIAYPAPGDPGLAERIRGRLAGAGFAARVAERGLDHGAWVPLMLAYPLADVPVVQVSLQPQLGAAHHLALGRALAGLGDEGVLVIGSGSATHNLAEIRFGGGMPAGWAVAFDEWLCAAASAGDAEALVDYRRRAPHAARNHPSEELYFPLLVALGGGGPGARGEVLHRSMTFGSLSMTDIAFHAPG